MIESAPGVDIRKKLFFTLSEKGWALIGLEALGLSIEDIFITVVNKSDEDSSPAAKYARRSSKTRPRSAIEAELAREMVADADKKREDASSDAFSDDEE